MRKGEKIILTTLIITMFVSMTFGCSLITKTAGTEGYVQVYETTGTKSKLMYRNNDITFEDADRSSVNTKISVDESDVKQEVEGFGAAMTHSSAYVLMHMNAEDRHDLLESLYGTGDNGAAFSMVRVPIGSSDYTTYVDGEMTYFTLDDMPAGETDEKLEHFNIDIDKKELIPVLKEILEINPNVAIVAAPWSAPVWMKESANLFRGSLDEHYEETYAEYLAKYVESYKNEGINIKYMSVQNEPMVDNMRYPVMSMNEHQMASVIGFLGEKLEEKDLDTKILAYDHNYDSMVSTLVDDYAKAVFEDDKASKYAVGIALHGYGTFNMASEFAEGFRVYNEKYGIKSFLTEIAEGTWSMDFASNLSYSLEKMVLSPLNYGSSGTMYWNIALYPDGTPAKTTNDCLGVVNVSKDTGDISKNSAFYSMAHVSKYIYSSEGYANLIGCKSDNPEVIASAFLRADGHVVTVVTNMSDKFANTVDINYDEKSFTYEIQPQSVVTFVW